MHCRLLSMFQLLLFFFNEVKTLFITIATLLLIIDHEMNTVNIIVDVNDNYHYVCLNYNNTIIIGSSAKKRRVDKSCGTSLLHIIIISYCDMMRNCVMIQ